jgi:DNA polymerase III alpha subunit
MKTDDVGIPRFSNQDLINMIYSGHSNKVHVVLCDPSDDVDNFNAAAEEQGLPTLAKYIPIDADKAEFDAACQSEWFMPEEYKNLDLREWFMFRLSEEIGMDVENIHLQGNRIEVQRLEEEFEAFYHRDMFDLLRYMIYLVDFMRDNNIVWGVGRGSSVASYVLYLIGVHKINPIQYGLDWREFLR